MYLRGSTTAVIFMLVYTVFPIRAGAQCEVTELTSPTGGGDGFGSSMAITDDGLAIGAPGDDLSAEDAGAVHIFRLIEEEWRPDVVVRADDGGSQDRFGTSIAFAGGLLAIGAPFAKGPDGVSQGAVYLFRKTGGTWAQVAKIIAPDGASGDEFGRFVDTDGSLVVVGAPGRDETAPDVGAVYVFRPEEDSWIFETTLRPIVANENNRWGAVSVHGDRVLVSTPNVALLFVFKRQGTEWAQDDIIFPRVLPRAAALRNDVIVMADREPFGAGARLRSFRRSGTRWIREVDIRPTASLPPYSVTMHGDSLLIGGRSSEDPVRGALYLFKRVVDGWEQQSIFQARDLDQTRRFGTTVAMNDAFILGTEETQNKVSVFSELGRDCNANGTPDGCEVRDGATADCNANGVPDSCDVVDQSSPDCNGNDIPDECDVQALFSADCNGNMIPDACEPGCNDNRIPDECDVAEAVLDFVALDSTLGTEGHRGVKAFGDLDGDGDVDVAMASRHEDTLRLLLNDGTGRFQQGNEIVGVGGPAVAVKLADWNSDGLNDLALASEDRGTISILLNQGGGAVTLDSSLPFINSSILMHVDDFDGNGFPDLLAADFSGVVSVFLNNGVDGEQNWQGFSDPIDVPVDGAVRAAVIADFNQDEIPDLVLSLADSQDEWIQWFHGDGFGRFLAASDPLFFRPRTERLLAGDLDMDGDSDLVMITDDRSREVRFLRNEGDGVFLPYSSLDTRDEVRSGNLGDLDGDGDLDFIAAIPGADRLTVSLNQGDGQFEDPILFWPVDFTSQISGLVDLDGDERLDLVLGTSTRGSFLLYLNRSFGGFNDCDENMIPDACDVADPTTDGNGDGIPDVCQSDCNENGTPDALEPDCDGNGVPDECDDPSRDLDGNGKPDVCDPDCDGDGIPDAYVLATGADFDCNGNSVPDACELAGGSIVLSEAVQVPVLLRPVAVAVADLDGDGTGEIIVAHRMSFALSIIRSTPDRTLLPPIHHFIGRTQSQLEVGDVDLDGDIDIVLGGGNLMLNRGDGVLADPVPAGGVLLNGPVKLGDLDGDGDLDMLRGPLLSYNRGLDQFGVWQGFEDPISTGLEGIAGPIGFADFDGNGALDLSFLVWNPDTVAATVALWNIDTASFVTTHGFGFQTDSAGLAVADFDADGLTDLAVSNRPSSDGQVDIVRNLGGGAFAAGPILMVGHRGPIAAADLNGNGLPDLVAGGGASTMAVLANRGGFNFDDPIFLQGLDQPVDVAIGDIDGDGALDIVIADQATDSVIVFWNLSSPHSEDCTGSGHPDVCDIDSGFEPDCDENRIPDSCEADCNESGVADACEISMGQSLDCNFNRIPDECELALDCNENGETDFCEIAEGSAIDCNANGVPDSCDLDCNANGSVDECEYAADFETPAGWTVGAPDDDATTGIWERVDPNRTRAQPENDHTPGFGTFCYVTGQAGVNTAGENDVDNGKTTLFSPVLDLMPILDPVVSYWRWYSNGEGFRPHVDVFVVDVSNDGGATWVNVETVGPAGAGTNGGWVFHEFRLRDFVFPSSQVVLRFVASDSGSLVEAAVDDFRISVENCACKGDVDHDGEVDAADIRFIQTRFGCEVGVGDVFCDAADANADGIVNGKDIGFSRARIGTMCRGGF